MSSRDAILSRVRKSLGVKAVDQGRTRAALARIPEHPRHPIPARAAGKSADELKALLRQQLEGSAARVIEVDSAADVPAAISTYLRDVNLPQTVRHGDDPLLAGLDWSSTPSLTVTRGRADPTDEVGLSRATAAVAETGTLMLASGTDNPVTLNFLPETHVVVVEAGAIVGPYEDGWALVRKRFGERTMPRTINMISGPSRTGDIGGRIVMGAHGPRRMCVVIVRS